LEADDAGISMKHWEHAEAFQVLVFWQSEEDSPQRRREHREYSTLLGSSECSGAPGGHSLGRSYSTSTERTVRKEVFCVKVDRR
jgi:hypothetical protein